MFFEKSFAILDTLPGPMTRGGVNSLYEVARTRTDGFDNDSVVVVVDTTVVLTWIDKSLFE